MKDLFSLFLGVVILYNGVAFAFETDQYSLPPKELADIGDEVAAHIAENISLAVDDLNRQINERRACIDGTLRGSSCGDAASERQRLAELLRDDAVARAVYERLAGGDLMTTKFGKWMAAHKFAGQPDRYWTDYSESIYLLNPPNYATMSPTVRLYGVEFGIDKLEHLLQQGYQYYEIEQKASVDGVSRADARKKAVEWGRKTERTYYGLLTSGVYSNADLYANYAGLKFFHNLTRPITLGNATLPAAVTRDGEKWRFGPERRPGDLLRPFISEHMNEALNPSAFRLTLVRSVRRAVRRHACKDWLTARPDMTAAAFAEKHNLLQTWHGEDYGWTERRRTVTLSETCFEQK